MVLLGMLKHQANYFLNNNVKAGVLKGKIDQVETLANFPKTRNEPALTIQTISEPTGLNN
jgi:hypothetical protein